MRGVRGVVGAAVLGYLIGTVPSADVASRLAGGPDLRSAGSGNPGAANAAAVLGPRFGLAVLAVDIAKGAIAGRVGGRLAGPQATHLGSTAAVIGHCHPIWTRFRGGKGVATSVGHVAVTFPAYAPLDAYVAIATASSSRAKSRAFAATAVSSSTWIAASVWWWRRGWPNLWGPTPTVALPAGAVVSSAVIMGRFLVASRAESARSAAGNGGVDGSVSR